MEQEQSLKKPKTFQDLHPGRFLKAEGFQGKKVTLKIKDVDREMLEGEDGKKSAKAIISFFETPLQLVSCKTTNTCLKEMFGDNLDDWKGKRVILFPTVWAGDPCIRPWGSPDIAEEFDVNVKLPRRKPFTMRMKKTANEQTGETK
jgi:hypothetical protein